MDKNNQFKSNIGFIILSVSIVIGCLILTENKVTYKDTSTPVSNFNESKVRLTGDISQLPLKINTNSNDVTYYSEIKVKEGEKLIIQLGNGSLDKIEGSNIVAQYHHISRLLTVESSLNGEKFIRYYNAPMKWRNEK